jgi:ATP-dependent RNA helicase DDX31/DBP7
MDSLLNELGGDSLGLNIVCETAPASNKPAKTRRKKNNKYEKRRAKARRANGEKAPGDIQNDKTSDAAVAKHGEVKDDAKRVDSGKADADADADVQATPEDVVPVEDVSNLVSQAMQGEEKISETMETEEVSTENKVAAPSEYANGTGNSWQKAIASTESTEMSRKQSHDVTAQVLQDDAKRAQYLSTYHARPYEMDRKSGAVSHIQESKESTHIFGEDGEHSEDESSCPFLQCGVHSRITKSITSDKFKLKRPTMIQRNAWSQMIPKNEKQARKNLFVQSETGSGKTLAFFIPLLQSLAVDPRTQNVKKVDRNLGGTRAIILCPTRELATQTYAVAEKLCQASFPWLVPGCLSGGEKRKSEKARLRKGVSILIATPGRLLDHLEKTDCLLMALKGKLEWIVLDESDRLLDMGLGAQVEQIVQTVRANQPKSGLKRDGITWQSILVSATITKQVEKLASKLLGGDTWVWARASKNSSDVKLIEENEDGGTDSKPVEQLSSAAPRQLTQLHMVVSSKLRLATLVAFLTSRVEKKERVVVFMSTCDGVDYHTKLFKEMNSIMSGDSKDTEDSKSNPGLFGQSCAFHRLHGNIPHRERHHIITNFSKVDKNQASVLITTDVTARGLNLPAVDWIVQYDPPCETADYIHRAGRAARAGKSGHALLFLLPSETQYVEVLKLRGLPNIAALSLATTLQNAARICADVTSEGLEQTGQGKKTTGSRIGEAFASAVQIRMEEALVEDDKSYKESLAKKVQNNKEASDKAQRKKERREAKNAIGPLLESARAAYNAYIRGYSTKEKAVRHIFSARALHLGHVARSFALKEQPKELSKAHRNARREESDVLKSTGRKRNSSLAFGKKGNRKNEEDESGYPLTSIAAAALEARPATAKKGKMMPAKKGTKMKKRVVEVDRNDDDDYDIPSQEQKPSYKNAKARMMAAADRVQSGGMEFF